jgi:glycolate oxidase FAD binding subunit
MLTPESIEEVQEAVRSQERVCIVGGGTKPALSRGANLSTAKLSGILEYEPSEYTFTALAGTPLAEIRDELAKNGQFLTFDPPLLEAGATLGGTVAAGLSGPGRFRFGGVRDFFLGVKMVTGEGQAIFGGGKVVKNAAGFDIPKLNVGGLGQWGVIVELTFKVFPASGEFATLLIETSDATDSQNLTTKLARAPIELFCLDSDSRSVQVRVGGLAEAIDARCERVQDLVGDRSTKVLRGEEDSQHWSDVREFRWVPDGHSLVKLPISPGEAASVNDTLSATKTTVPHRYSVGGNVVWIAWPDSLGQTEFDRAFATADQKRLALTGSWEQPAIAASGGAVFADRLQTVFDPTRKFAE